MYENICDKVIYVLDGKRSSAKPIYNKKFKKPINKEKLKDFLNVIYSLIDV